MIEGVTGEAKAWSGRVRERSLIRMVCLMRLQELLEARRCLAAAVVGVEVFRRV